MVFSLLINVKKNLSTQNNLQITILFFALSFNKRPMGHIAHLRKQFKSIIIYDYIITLIKREKHPLLSL